MLPIKIISSLYYYLLMKLNLLDDNVVNVYNSRKTICRDCPIRSGSMCSRRKAQALMRSGNLENRIIKVPIIHFLNPIDTFYYKGAIWKKGCGCFLFLKRLHLNEMCPLKKW